jgi:hypothetical protein
VIDKQKYGSQLTGEDIRIMTTGRLVHIMLCNFEPKSSAEPPYAQNGTYLAAAEELDRRAKGDDL